MYVFSFVGCKRENIESVKEEVIKIVEDSSYDVNIVGKYREGIVVNLTFGGIDSGAYHVEA